MKIKLLKILILLTLVSSNENNEKELATRNIVKVDLLNELKPTKNLFNTIDSVKLIKLETSDKFYISDISKLLLDEKYFYVLDNKSKALYKFNLKGKFILKISNLGRGPEEFTRPSDFILLENKIVILDGYSSKLLFYDKNGVFLNEFFSEAKAEKFGKIDANRFIMFSDNKIKIINNKGKELNEFDLGGISFSDKSLSLYKESAYLDNKLSFIRNFNNGIFSATKDSVCKRYQFDFGKYNLDTDFLRSLRELPMGDIILKLNRKKDMVCLIDFYSETQNYIYFQFVKKGKIYNLYHDKKKEVNSIFKLEEFPKWFRKIYRAYIYSAQNSNTFITSINPYIINKTYKKSDLNNMGNNKLFSHLVPYFKNANDLDNPFILIYYFK